MPRKSNKQPPLEAEKLPNLTRPRAQAEQEISAQIEKGNSIRARPIQSEQQLNEARAAYSSWSDYNVELLRRVFTNGEISDDYDRRGQVMSFDVDRSLGDVINWFYLGLDGKLQSLKAIKDRLELFEEPSPAAITQPQRRHANVGQERRAAFVVHGHDTGARESVARFLEKLDVEAIILHERPNEGRTLIEKFEAHSDVPFAVVLLTADDVGAAKIARLNSILARGRT